MLTRANLTANPHFTLHPPATDTTINAAEDASNIPFPPEYRALLRLTNGLYSDGCLVLYAAEDLTTRNQDYEVPTYLPDYLMIGDDSGGQAILIDRSGALYEVGMGVMDADWLEPSAASLADLLITHAGRTLSEREDD